MNPDYLNINRNTWDSRVESHAESAFYGLDDFLKGKEILNEPELRLLGDCNGKTLLHLQCHFGMDSLALARHGAVVTGVDFSPAAIRKAAELSNLSGLDARFICSDIYELPEKLKDTFELVFTSYGTVGWLPDTGKWAKVIEKMLAPGGKFVMVDFHPALWMFDNDFEHIQYSYFNRGPIEETVQGSYADRRNDHPQTTVSWNHSLADILSALLNSGLSIEHFSEYDYSPYPCFNHLEASEEGRYRIRHLAGKIPMVYAIVAGKALS